MLKNEYKYEDKIISMDDINNYPLHDIVFHSTELNNGDINRLILDIKNSDTVIINSEPILIW